MAQHFLTMQELGTDGLLALLKRSAELKQLRGQAAHPRPLAGKSVAIIMEKASTRTRVSFEVGVAELGGQPLVLPSRDIQLSRSEPIEDTARVLSRYVHAIVLRTHGHELAEKFAIASSIPVINALTDTHHPCQLLADLLTVSEHVRKPWSQLRAAWVGDGNNMAHSWIVAASMLGFELTLACPKGYTPNADVLARAQAVPGARIHVTTDMVQASRGADVVTTDVWASMGQEGEAAARHEAFAGYKVSASTMSNAAAGAIFLHCLPAHRGEEVDAEVIDGPTSRVWDEAENRLHTQKALLELLCC